MVRRVEEFVSDLVLVKVYLVLLNLILEFIAANIDVVDSSCQRCCAYLGTIHRTRSYDLLCNVTSVGKVSTDNLRVWHLGLRIHVANEDYDLVVGVLNLLALDDEMSTLLTC